MKKISVFGLIVLILLCLSGCSSSDSTLEGYVDEAQYAECSPGTWVVGEDISPGHYEITSSGASSGLTVASNRSDASYTQYLGTEETVQSYTTWLTEGEMVIVENSSLIFSPSELEANMHFGAGCYVVGCDLDPGDYTVQVKDSESLGHIYHVDQDGADLTYAGGFGTVTSGHDLDLTLSEGDRVYVHNVDQVVLKRSMTNFTV